MVPRVLVEKSGINRDGRAILAEENSLEVKVIFAMFALRSRDQSTLTRVLKKRRGDIVKLNCCWWTGE